jgi:hypothetical protein
MPLSEKSLNQCQALFDAGDIDGADVLIRPLARFSGHGSPLRFRIFELETKIVDAIIERDCNSLIDKY